MAYYVKQNKLRFKSKDVVATQGAIALLQLQNKPKLGEELIFRHFSGDWGDVCEEDRKVNEDGIDNNQRLMSVYHVGGEKIWLITEWDRSVTTILLPDEY